MQLELPMLGHMTISKRQLLLASFCIVLAIGPNGASGDAPPEGPAASQPEDNWEFDVVPYVFLPAMTGSTTIKGLAVPVDTTIGDIFTETDLILSLSLNFEAWYKRRWGALFNGMWSTLKQRDNVLTTPGPVPIQSLFDVTMNMGLFEVAGLYHLGGGRIGAGGPEWDAQALLGTRIATMHVSLEFDAPLLGNRSGSQTWAYPIVGARGSVQFGPQNRWVANLRADVGGLGGSDLSWNVVGGFGYDFQVGNTRSTILLLGRALSQDYRDSDFAWDVIEYGPVLGWNFRF